MKLTSLALATLRKSFLSLLLLSWLLPASAAVRLPNVFGNDMVLQRDQPVRVWGWADSGEKVTVQLGSDSVTSEAKDGAWSVTLPPRKAGGPLVLTVKGSNTIQFENVMIGEVWLCSGQSNMEMGIGGCLNGPEEIAAADHPQIRLLMVQNRWLPHPTNNFDGSWKVCSPKTVAEGGWGGFSAAAYYFGRELHKKLGVPIGLIDATWGGTCVESWTAPEGFSAVPSLGSYAERVELGDPRSKAHQARLGELLAQTQTWLDQSRAAMGRGAPGPAMPVYPKELLPPGDLQNPTALYNGMINPVKPFAIRGAIWYQGEANLNNGAIYTDKMRALITGWRKVWDNPDFPFYFVQIAPFNYGGDAERMGDFWEAQAKAQEIPNVGMAVITDIGDLKDIHPRNKQEVGRRLALWALARTYGQQDLVYSGAVFKEMKLEGNQVRVVFDNAKGGLTSRDGGPLSWFEVIDADQGGWVKADARIEGEAVILTSAEVKRPVAMRFAWHMLAEPNLMNKAGLPATAFRAGTVPKRDVLTMKVPESRDYELLYDIDLATLGEKIKYATDNSASFRSKFDRVAYVVELLNAAGESQYVYASMDAFTTNLAQLGIPTVESRATFQQPLRNLNVFSNAKGITTGSGLKGGNIEFWPNNYGPGNSAKVPKASAQTYDFGDQPSDPENGYGSMQVHNAEVGQTLFAINHWGVGDRADIGIGNAPSGNPDWTFSGNAGTYQAKRLRVLVRPVK